MRMTKAGIASAAVLAGLAVAAPATASTTGRASPGSATPQAAKPALAYSHLNLPNKVWAQVYSDGMAILHAPGGKSEVRRVPLLNPEGGAAPLGAGAADLPGKGQLIDDLTHGAGQPYAAGQVLVIYKSQTSALSHTLTALGADHRHQLFTGAEQAKMASLRDTAQQRTGKALLDFPDAQVLHITASSVPDAVAKLRANPDVAFAEPDWTVSTTNTTPAPVPSATVKAAAAAAKSARPAAIDGTGVPSNYDLTSSGQSMLDAPGVNAVPSYSELAKRYGQLPGQGEIITNVSLGTLDDASAAANTSDKCNFYAANYGPTTIMQGGQRYLDWPSMPLIPTYTASSSGVLDPGGETCGDDPQLAEIGLDFSMMAPLPHQLQRPDEAGSGLTDLLGIAPGASYRLVVPSDPGGLVSDVDAAFLAAATQTPRPDVITASLGFGLDAYGFGSRYLEEDPMTQSVVSAIVASGIVFCVSANDGLRQATNAAVAPSGGSVATNVTSRPSQVTDLNDLEFSSAPSRVLDSGAIDVGGTTLNDIFAAPPDNPAYAALASTQAFPATRYTGARNYSSGYGSRVNIAAPGDNVLSVAHPFGGAADSVMIVNEGGTSASAPQVAAAAAVVLQVAKLTHNSGLAGNPLAVRSFLQRTATPVPGVPQSDTPLSVGPQVNIGHAVEALLGPVSPGVARVAVAQRHQGSALGGSISTSTDPSNISLAGRLSNAWITIAPDWTGLPGGTSFKLTGPNGQLASTSSARLQPSAILASAGLPLASADSRDVPLTYSAMRHGKVIAQATVTLTFGPWDGTTPSVQAPVAPSVVHGPVIPVTYDITGLSGATTPELVVSHPGRIDPATGLFFRPAYAKPLTAPKGTINVPVSALQGAGIYGIGIQESPGGWAASNYSAYAFTRVAPTGDAQPQVPTLSAAGSAAGHFLEIPYNGSFQLHYDVTGVPGATGAIAEFSAPGPTPFFFSYSTFDNPNGSERDANGRDTGSVAYVRLSGGARGTVTFDGAKLGLDPSMYHTVRVLATRGNGRVVGEASGVSALLMDGVVGADGGSPILGFGVNPSGKDGLLTSNQNTAGGGLLSSVATFDQQTGATKTIASSTADQYTTMDATAAGIFANDVGLYGDYNLATQNQTYNVLSPAATGTASGSWTPPDSLGQLINIAQNTSTSQDALLNYNSGLQVTPTDIAKNTFGTPVDLSPAESGMQAPSPGGFAENPATGQAVVGVFDSAKDQNTTPADLITVDMATGKTQTFPGATFGFVGGIGVNPETNKVAEGSFFPGFGIVDLATHQTTLAQPGGQIYRWPTAIPGTSDFMVAEVASPDMAGTSPNNNALSSIIITDSNGNVLHRYEDFNFYNTYLPDMGSLVQASSATSTGWVLGPLGGQLHPFSYSTGK